MAGLNVSVIGLKAYSEMENVTLTGVALSAAVFCIFGALFFRLSVKHSERINGYKGKHRPFWDFFDLKSYLIMLRMMSGGIWLRFSGLVSEDFISVFYSGLGLALSLAGMLFIYFYAVNRDVSA